MGGRVAGGIPSPLRVKSGDGVPSQRIFFKFQLKIAWFHAFLLCKAICGQKPRLNRPSGGWICKTHGSWKFSRGFNSPTPPSTCTLTINYTTICLSIHSLVFFIFTPHMLLLSTQCTTQGAGLWNAVMISHIMWCKNQTPNSVQKADKNILS